MTADTIAPTAALDLLSLHHRENVATFISDDGRSSEVPKADQSVAAMDGISILEGPYSRFAGETEGNWCRAVASGTGITVLAFLFSRGVNSTALQRAVDSVQEQHPRLRSSLLWIQGRPAFQVAEHPSVEVETIDSTSLSAAGADGRDCVASDDRVSSGDDCTEQLEVERDETFGNAEARECGDERGDEGGQAVGVDGQQWSSAVDLQDEETCEWLRIVEAELNVNLWPEHADCMEPMPMFVVRLHLLPENRSLLIVRVHTAVCDRVGAATVVGDMMKYLRRYSDDCSGTDVDGKRLETSPSFVDESQYLGPVEDAIPPGKANKPFWAHGIDLLGYSLGSKRHALLPFEEAHLPRSSKFFHCTLHAKNTSQLLEACESRSIDLSGALTAAGMKATAAMKSLDRRSEHYAIVSLVNCRQYLEPQLSESSVGFYHSALMNTHHVNEHTDFWDLAERSHASLRNAVRNRKHFTDMGDLNYLMYQAIQHPNLTPQSSMRTSLMVAFQDAMHDDTEELRDALGVEHYLGCSSIHGVGPTLAIFDSIRQGTLHISAVYSTPLYSRAQIRKFVQYMMDFILEALDA